MISHFTSASPKPIFAHSLPFLFLALLEVAGLIFAYKHFDDTFEEVDGELVIEPEYKDKIDKRITKPFNCQTYELRATITRCYPFTTCEDGMFFVFLKDKYVECKAEEARTVDSFFNDKTRSLKSFYSIFNKNS